MRLFGDSSGPHMMHFQAHRERGYVELGGDVRNAPALRWPHPDLRKARGATDPVESRYQQGGDFDGEFERALLLTSHPGTGSAFPR